MWSVVRGRASTHHLRYFQRHLTPGQKCLCVTRDTDSSQSPAAPPVSSAEKEDHDVFGTLAPSIVKRAVKMTEKRKEKFVAAKRMKVKRIVDTEKGEKVLDVSPKEMREQSEEWSEEFGTLAEDVLKRLESDRALRQEDKEQPPHRRLSLTGRRHHPHWYGRQIEKLGKAGKVYEAIEMLETQMIEKDRVMPTPYAFTALIGVLGRVGYTKKAFQLFNKMKKFGLTPEHPTYTALFNACSNSPWRPDGLKRAHYLRELMAEKAITPNLVTYRSMVKAFGLLGDIQTAFSLVDEIERHRYPTDGEVFQHLLIACISDKEAGFKHAIEVWRRMKKRHIPPTTAHYNLLLRAVRDCGLGDAESASQLIQRSEPAKHLPNHSKKILPEVTIPRITIKELEDDVLINSQTDGELLIIKSLSITDLNRETPGHSEKFLTDYEEAIVTIEEHRPWWHYDEDTDPSMSHEVVSRSLLPEVNTHVQDLSVPAAGSSNTMMPPLRIPNILNPYGEFDSVMELSEMATPPARLLLLGGVDGIISRMKEEGVSPDIKTVTQLVDIIESTLEAEQHLLGIIAEHGVKLDMDFYNALIRKRNLRKDFSSAKDVLDLAAKDELHPNIMTFGCLAMGCYRMRDGLQLLDDMSANGIVPSVEVYGILTHRSWLNFEYKEVVLQHMRRQRILPNKALIQHVENQIEAATSVIVRKEKGGKVDDYFHSDYFMDGYRKFRVFYKKWLLTSEADVDDHPWLRFQQPHPETQLELQNYETSSDTAT